MHCSSCLNDYVIVLGIGKRDSKRLLKPPIGFAFSATKRANAVRVAESGLGSAHFSVATRQSPVAAGTTLTPCSRAADSQIIIARFRWKDSVKASLESGGAKQIERRALSGLPSSTTRSAPPDIVGVQPMPIAVSNTPRAVSWHRRPSVADRRLGLSLRRLRGILVIGREVTASRTVQ